MAEVWADILEKSEKLFVSEPDDVANGYRHEETDEEHDDEKDDRPQQQSCVARGREEQAHPINKRQHHASEEQKGALTAIEMKIEELRAENMEMKLRASQEQARLEAATQAQEVLGMRVREHESQLKEKREIKETAKAVESASKQQREIGFLSDAVDTLLECCGMARVVDEHGHLTIGPLSVGPGWQQNKGKGKQKHARWKLETGSQKEAGKG